MDDINPDWTAIVAEHKIREAMDAGEFDNLPGMGKPLDLDEDPFTPAHLRIANKLLKNARALPEWIQLEHDITRETAALVPARERGLRAVQYGKNAASKERAAHHLRTDYAERLDLINTLLLKYVFVTPGSAQKPHSRRNIKREMAELEAAIAEKMNGVTK